MMDPPQYQAQDSSTPSPTVDSRTERGPRSGNHVCVLYPQPLIFDPNSWPTNVSAFFSSPNPRAQPAVESAVTRLLVSIKALLESLTRWSEQHITDMDVSDVYVRLGNDFNAAVAAFAAYNIDMK